MTSDIDKAFEQLKRDGKNNLENILRWLKEAKVVNDQYKEEKVKRFYEGMDKNKIELEKFHESLKKIAEEQKKELNHIHKQLLDESNKFVGALKAGIKAFQDNMNK